MEADTFILQGESGRQTGTSMLRGVSEMQANTFALQGAPSLDSDTFTLLAEGAGYMPGLIVPSVILMVALLGVAVLLVVTRQSGDARDEDG